MILHLALRLLARAVAALPFRALPRAGAVVGWFFGRLVRVRRAHVLAAMRRAGIAAPERAADAMYRGLGAGALEVLWMVGRPRAPLGAHVRLTPAAEQALRAARARGHGVVVAATHTGNWELAACAVAHELGLWAVTKRQSVGAFDRFSRAARAGRGIRLCDPRGALRVASAALARGEVVAMVVDQVPSAARHAVRAPFLGADALVDRAPAALAAHAGAPLLVCAGRRDEARGVHVIDVLATLDPPPRARRRAWVDEASRAATAALERFVRQHPESWLWLHRRWGEPRAERA